MPHHVVVNLDEDGELVCCCPYQEYLRGNCECRDLFDCPEAMLTLQVIPGTKPSDKAISEIKKTSREIKKYEKETKKANDRIKQGLSELEKATKGNRWRI